MAREDWDERDERDDEDRPLRRRRRARDEYDDEPRVPKKSVSVIGMIALIGAIMSLLLSFIPCIGVFAIIGGVVNLIGGFIAWLVARNSQGQTGTGIPLASVLVSILAIVVSGAWLGLLYLLSEKVPKIDESIPPIAVNAVGLDQEYDDNELAADAKYKHKRVDVFGRIKKITKDDKPGKITVELIGSDNTSTVDCHFDKYDKAKEAEVAALRVDQEATIRGVCRGKKDGWVTVDQCSVVKNAAPPPPPVFDPKNVPPIPLTAETLDKEFTTKPVGASLMYKKKLLELTGKVVRVTRDKPGKATVELEGHEGATVDCRFVVAEQGPLAKLAPGDMVVLRGVCLGNDEDDTVVLDNCVFVKTLPNTPKKP